MLILKVQNLKINQLADKTINFT